MFRAACLSAAMVLSSAIMLHAANLSGKWKGKIEVNGESIDLVYDLKADGDKLTGSVTGPIGTLKLEKGKIDGDKISFELTFGDNHVRHEGKLADGKIKITTHMPQGDRQYTVARAAGIDGKWETKIKLPDGTELPLKYDFKTDGKKLSGTVESPAGTLDLQAGKIDGEHITYKLTIMDKEVSYQGTVADEKIHLKSHGGPFGDREYTLTRPVERQETPKK
jgi:hypothetical protein